ncbi:transposase domain-containing protein [Streptomyces anulatus]|uniref:transposase domain-containing protein n=1 Tax=Streptomyces anulatus TaxID=1892 RepID=UPI003F4A0386
MSRLERLGLGILTRSCPPELVDRVVAEAGCGERRRRLLSARFTPATPLPPLAPAGLLSLRPDRRPVLPHFEDLLRP